MKSKDWLLFWFLGIVWGTSFLWIKIGVKELSPVLLVGYRTLFASIGLGFIWLLTKKNYTLKWQEVRGRLFDFFLMGAFNIAIPWMMFSWAGQFIDSGVSSILNSAMPLFTILISPIFISDDRITMPKVAGLITGFVGVVILMSPGIREGWTSSLAGQAVALMATVFYAIGTVYARKKGHGLPAQLQAFLQLSMGSLIIWIVALFIEHPITLPQLPITWVATLWLGLLGSCLAYIIYFKLLHEIGPTRMSMVTYIPPLVGVLLGVVFLGERFYWQALFGALLILSGISIVNLRPKPSPEKQI
ncbi:MAG TPA: EamA family transporter [Pelolinea sp.]|nr:EamA family transporter [Pelolinea sp.]